MIQILTKTITKLSAILQTLQGWIITAGIFVAEYFFATHGTVVKAVSPYKDDMINHTIHYAGTTLAMLCVLLLWLTKGKYQIPVVVFIFGIVSPCMTRRWLLMLELIMFTLTFIYGLVSI